MLFVENNMILFNSRVMHNYNLNALRESIKYNTLKQTFMNILLWSLNCETEKVVGKEIHANRKKDQPMVLCFSHNPYKFYVGHFLCGN